MPPTTWKKHLEAVDFINVQICTEDGASGHEFFFVAQKAHSHGTPSLDAGTDLQHIYSYECGNEIELQQNLGYIDTAVPNTIYLLAMRGRDADAALGLCSSLRQEIPLWNIRLAILDSGMDLSDPIPMLIRHMNTFNAGDTVVLFDADGAAHVPRVVLSPPPISTTPCVTTVPIRRTIGDTFRAGSTTTRLRSRAAPPFRGDCAYILLGGIGGLGIDLAVWLYQVIHSFIPQQLSPAG
jgi:hypothetical protein